MESTRAIQEVFETDMLNTVGDFYKQNPGPHEVNGFPHCVVSSNTDGVIELDHFRQMNLYFDKANVPLNGRVAILDPVQVTTLEGMVTITSDISQFAVDIIKDTMSSGMQLKFNLFGWDVIKSNRLPTGEFDDGTTKRTGVAAIFMSILDDNTKPLMGAWRRMPKVEGERNKDLSRDEYVTKCRYGFGLQREDTLGIVVTDAVKFNPVK